MKPSQARCTANVTMDVMDAVTHKLLRRSKHKNLVVDSGLNLIRDWAFGTQDPLELVSTSQLSTQFISTGYSEDEIAFDHVVHGGTTTLVVTLSLWLDAPPVGVVTAVTVGGVPMVKAIGQVNIGMNSEIWYLDSPPLGNQNILVTLDGFTDGRKIAATNLFGTISPSLDVTGESAGFTTALATSVTPVQATSVIIDCLTTFDGTTAIKDASQTTILKDDTVQLNAGQSYFVQESATPKAMSWSWTTEGDASHVVAAFKAAPTNVQGITKGAVGIDDTSVAPTDTELASEIYRADIIQHNKGAQQLQVLFFVAADKGNVGLSTPITEVGLLTDSNRLYARVIVDPIVKTSAIVLTFTWTLTWAAVP